MTTTKDDKLDLVKEHKDEYSQPKKPKLIETKPGKYLSVDGSGQPGGEVFQAKVGALYGMAYTLKFQSKFAGRDYTVCKLEGIYGIGGQTAADFDTLPPEQWKWRLMIRVPEFITKRHIASAVKALREKGKEGDFEDVVLETIDEGPCVQMLHVGPYDAEQETIEQMQAFADEQGLEPHMWHHEIYLSDPRRIPPEKLKTILRMPVRTSS
jgi:hypothetical protein